MARLNSELVVRLTDRVTGPARTVARSLAGITQSARGVKGADFGSRLNDAMQRNQRQIARTRGQLVDAAAGFYAIKAAIASPISAALQFESVMADVAKVVDFESPEVFSKFQRDIEDLSTKLPIGASALADIAASAGEAGFKADELLKVTEAAAKIGVAFGISAEQAGEALPQLMNAMGLSLDEVLQLSDGINHLSNNMAAGAPKVLDFMGRIGGDISKFGFSAEEASAFGAAMIAAGAQSDVAATSFRNMGNRLTKGASATKRQRDAFKALGLDATDVAEDMQRDAVGTTLSVIEAIADLPKAQQAALMSDLFGDEARALAPLLANTDLLRDALGLIADEVDYAGSAMREFEVRNSTSGSQMEQFGNRLTNLKAAIGRGLIPVLVDLIDRVTPAIEKITEFSNAHPELIGNVLAVTAAVVGFKSTMIGLKFVGLLGRGGALSLLSIGFKTGRKSAIFFGRTIGQQVALDAALARSSGKNIGILGRLRSSFKALGKLRPIRWAAFIPRLVWRNFIGAIRWLPLIGGLSWRNIVSPLRWTGRLIPSVRWASMLGRLSWRALITPLRWGARLIPGIGWALLAGDLAWNLLVKPLGWDKYLPEINWSEIFGSFTWEGWLPEIDWARIFGSITWPEPPRWIRWLMGDEDTVKPTVQISDTPGFSSLSAEHQAAAQTVGNAANLDPSQLPSPEYFAELAEYAAYLREEIARTQSLIEMTGDPTGQNQINLQNLQNELAELEQEGETARAEAERLITALGVLSETDASPEISTASIDAALAKVSSLSSALSGLPSAGSGGGSAPSFAGQRASGGPMAAGRTYLTGEKGPELITPDRASWVTTNQEIIAGLRERARAASMLPAQSGPSPSGGSRTVSLTTGPIIVQGAQDPREVAEQVIGELSGRLQAAVDGGYFD